MSFGQVVLLLIGAFVLYFVVKNFGTLLMFTAMRTYSKGDKERAVKRLEKALGFPMGPQQKLTTAFFLLKEGQLDKAEVVIAPLRTVTTKRYNPNKARVYYSLIQWKRGELDLAVESLEGLLAEDYKTGILYTNLGYFLIEKGDIERALEVNLAGYDYDSTSLVIGDNLGLTYIKLGEWEKAVEIYEKLLPEVPGFPDVYYNRALIHAHFEEWEEAKDLLIKAEGKSFSFLSTMTKEHVASFREEIEEKIAESSPL